MGTVRTIKSDDGKPYISLEDLIKEVDEAKKYSDANKTDEEPNFFEIVQKTLRHMEEEYYSKYIFNKK